jgi:hypothetical protein
MTCWTTSRPWRGLESDGIRFFSRAPATPIRQEKSHPSEWAFDWAPPWASTSKLEFSSRDRGADMLEIAFKHCTARKLMPFYPS